ncbi:hypothetical protein F5B22DRAFT_594702 [Xylaria bambusicola]|uniref:uncharacterized protein n=1 Tax=Xylaria bambusicola TaxID=326684 RepID=UPI0020086B92|nr:uncharacterized protein F5B22DRAFT_594702 [Xylaria bambusicola]KAI0521923.1 hypothetical protein F5B22DRAFT_594702 [Xylaria bambusicola]
MSFQFVNQSDITNTRERKLIRSHVMKGKNLGKKKPKRKQQSESTPSTPIVSERPEIDNGASSLDLLRSLQRESSVPVSVPVIFRQVANEFNTLISMTGVNVTSETVSYIRHMFFYVLDVTSPAKFCQSTGVTAQMWAHLAIHNKAYFHCTIAMASACAAFVAGDSYHSPVALGHMSQAYRLLNDRLSSKEPLSDTTVAVVAAINVYDRLYGDPQKAMVHLNGLVDMIASIGGISELAKRNIIIAEKIFQCDIELALSCGSTPKFSTAVVPPNLVLTSPLCWHQPHGSGDAELMNSVLYQSVSAELGEPVLEALRFSRILDQATHAQKLDSLAYQCTHIYIGYRLLETKLHNESGAGTGLDALVHVALTGFHNTFCFSIGGKLLAFPLIMDRFRTAAQSARGDDRVQQMVVFWALLMGRISALAGDDDTWLVVKVEMLARDLGLRTWAQVSDALGTFPWVKAVHDAHGERFWRAKIERGLPVLVA